MSSKKHKKYTWSEESIAKTRKTLKERLSGHAIPQTLVGLEKNSKYVPN